MKLFCGRFARANNTFHSLIRKFWWLLVYHASYIKFCCKL